ncbi:MAG: hypothetical protein IME94_02600 [Proteobacteria bacterium]|nr:hypothetical protein [Pseudomonadota bacterium]
MFKKSILYPLIISASAVSAVLADDAESQKFYDTELLITTLTADDQEALIAAQETSVEATQAAADAAAADAAAADAAAADAAAADAAAADDAAADAAAADDAAADAAAKAADASPEDPDLNATAAALQETADETDADALQVIADVTDADALQATAALTDTTALEATADLTDAAYLLEIADDAGEALTIIQDDIALTATLVGVLSDEQVFAMNRSLNNAADGKLLVNIDALDLQMVLDGNYNKQQINAFTQSFEQEARFQLKADKFTAKHEETGDDKFLDKADMMFRKGEMQKNKFLTKIDNFSLDDEVIHHGSKTKLIKGSAQASAKDSAKSSSKGVGKSNAKDSAKSNAKVTAKSNAKEVAKSNAKSVAKEKAKANSRDKIKSNNGRNS